MDLVRSILSPCGKFIISGSMEGTVCIWNVEKNTLVQAVGHLSEVNGVDWTHTSQNCIASASDDLSVIIWNY